MYEHCSHQAVHGHHHGGVHACLGTHVGYACPEAGVLPLVNMYAFSNVGLRGLTVETVSMLANTIDATICLTPHTGEPMPPQEVGRMVEPRRLPSCND